MTALTLPLAAIAAGMISFSSPCCLPLVPSYLSYVSALPVSHLGEREARATTLRAALLFVAGFSVAFTALGISFALVGSLLLERVPIILRLAGVGIIVLGLTMIGVLRIPMIGRERRLDLARLPSGPAVHQLAMTRWRAQRGRRSDDIAVPHSARSIIHG